MPTKSAAIKLFLTSKGHVDFANRYHLGMECQVNVAQDGGERVSGEFKGRRWHGWSDGVETWKSFRIPWKANSAPEYIDSEISWNLATHTEAIGMTGWNWEEQISRWVAFDFDALIGHSEKHRARLTQDELAAVIAAATEIPWVTIRKSASGRGLHLYVDLPNVSTANHNEHAALARSILGMMSASAGFDFEGKVDACGGNMWVWHRKAEGTDGFEVVKYGGILPESSVPKNWKDHLKVITGKRRSNLPHNIDAPQQSIFEILCGQRPRIKLDETHKKLITYLEDSNALWWWDQDNHMLVTHTAMLAEAHKILSFIGTFQTNTTAKDLDEQNCFLFPMKHGAWSVRRYTQGIQEHDSWDQDGQGWTCCYYNRVPDLATAARSIGGLEDPAGGYVFREASTALSAVELLGIHLKIGTALQSRKTVLKPHKSGRLQIEIKHEQEDRGEDMPGWFVKKGHWVKMFKVSNPILDEPEVGIHDDVVRHLVSSTNEDCGWVIRSDNKWRTEPKSNVLDALSSMGMTPKEGKLIVGSSVFRPWQLVNKPFQPEYPGDRCWNQHAAQLRFTPSTDLDNLKHPHWNLVLEHCGSGLDDTVKEHPWCKMNGLKTGGEYLMCWIAALFQHPEEPLPYLFLYSQEQNTGKSIFHEALSLLTTKGYQKADLALTSQSGFNGELEGAIICVVEEVDLSTSKTAYNRIKEWVTSKQLNIRHLYRTPFHIPNTTHWIQCANDHKYCPVFPGDTRITILYVKPLSPTELIPKRQLLTQLEKEAPDFLASITTLELPDSQDRLMIPVVNTQDKRLISKLNQSPLEMFIEEITIPVEGQRILFSEFYEQFIKWLDPEQKGSWSKIRVGKELPPNIPKARARDTGQFWIGNVWWKGKEPEKTGAKRFFVNDKYLDAAYD